MTKSQGVLRPLSLRAPRADLARSTMAALGLSAALLGSPALAQQAATADEDGEVQLDTLKIEDRTADVSPYSQKGAPYKARVSGDERHTRPLAETPQTITVLTQTQIRDSGQTDLARILEAQPGVTLGTGENGNAFGDRYIIRGQEARSDVFVDGLRDPGMTIRESFAVEQIEIAKGPNSTFAGRGTSGGAINAITKMASADYNFGKASLGLGSDSFLRTTADVNLALADQLGVRGNVLYAYQTVPDRDPADRERKGLALTALYKPASNLSITLDYYGLRARDKPDLGSYLLTDPATGQRRPKQDLPAYVQAEDFLTSKVDTFTGRLRYEFSPSVTLSNIVRYGMSDNAYVTTGARGATTSVGNPGGVYATSVLDAGHTGWQKVRYFADQANLHVTGDLLGARHELILGGEYTRHKVDSGSFVRSAQAAFNCRTGAGGGALDQFCLTGADGAPLANINHLARRVWTPTPFATRNWQVETVSGSVMDTVDLTSRATVFAGARVDHFKYTLGANDGSTGLRTSYYDYSDTLWNGHLGLTYKLGEAMVYVSAASAADVNGGESDTGTSSGYGGLVVFNGDVASAKPERSLNLELGAKFDLFDERLLITTALFQSTKYDVMEGADYGATGTFNTGRNRVRGFELGVSGNLTSTWWVQGGLTVMDSKVLRSANVGISAAQLALGASNVGKELSNFARVQAELQTRLQLTDRFALGGAVKYKSRRYGGQPDTGAAFTQTVSGFSYNQPVPAYTVGDLFFEYKFSDKVDLQVNVTNLTNETYYLAVYRSGTFLYQGDKRRVVGTLNVAF